MFSSCRPPFGHALRGEFLFAANTTQMNHGAYGATPRKVLDASRLKRLGWAGKTGLDDGLEATYDWYRSNVA